MPERPKTIDGSVSWSEEPDLISGPTCRSGDAGTVVRLQHHVSPQGSDGEVYRQNP
jgi:hypothetical protein